MVVTVLSGKLQRNHFRVGIAVLVAAAVIAVLQNNSVKFAALAGTDQEARAHIPELYRTHSKWNRTTLTYQIDNCPTNLECEAAKQVVRDAIEAWDAASGLTLDEVNSSGDIVISWASGDHGDSYDFDGKGGTVAHAAYPGRGHAHDGDVHLDDAENWVLSNLTDRYPEQVHLKTVIMHEVGHALGLDHSNKPSSLMWAVYSGARSMTDDDISAIQSLYGK